MKIAKAAQNDLSVASTADLEYPRRTITTERCMVAVTSHDHSRGGAHGPTLVVPPTLAHLFPSWLFNFRAFQVLYWRDSAIKDMFLSHPKGECILSSISFIL